MHLSRTIKILARIYLLLSAGSFFMVSMMGFFSPQAVMDLVQVKLPNNDAFSSIRGVYGGVGLTITVMLVRWALKDIQQGVVFLCWLWGLYALSRIITWTAEGPLGAFGTQWLVIESVFFAMGMLLFLRLPKNKPAAHG
ncbi:DUF4345 domain-containing protein [Chitinophaga oryzae]|uniref:DUF4345 domain-containing protein n=1 Tax=Chitinophaga oryzae TaxID=2725414 RepID=A0AAE6ZEX5_9BACT|nr:DUF4345 domain-containing protein [Chitinophaga oryzae]QJB30607.1 DUF4345 domain-containing protein [Chitinophaga oryzae]QJB37107.1 DUF4345 domain-containing protein [Chitinophaga oryzae]